MSATATASVDFSGTTQVPLLRLAKVETRKALDTRAGRWSVIAILVLVVVVEAIYAFAARDEDKNFQDLLQIPGAVLGYFLPMLPILLVTSEASQRNGLVTFTLEPRRSRVVLAKFMAGVTLALAVMVLGFVLAALGTLLATLSGTSPSWSLEPGIIVNAVLLGNLIGVFVGFALGMLFMNTPAAIVAYFVYSLILPVAAGILSALSSGFEKVAPWIEFNTAQTPLISGDFSPTGQEWTQIVVTGVIWLLIPLAIGIWRLLRIEFK